MDRNLEVPGTDEDVRPETELLPLQDISCNNS